MSGKIGDKVGYVVVSQHAGHWAETDCPQVDTIGQAVGVLREYQEAEPQTTYAVARMHLVMISRPNED